jgi:hypothetical protein
MLYRGGETIELLTQYLQPALTKLMELPERLYQLVLVCDLKALALISDLYEGHFFCLFCKCHKNERHEFKEAGQKWEERTLKFPWGLKFIVQVCVLHLKMRFVECFLRLYLKTLLVDVEKDIKVQQLTECIRMFTSCTTFNF